MEKQPCIYILASARNGTLYVGVTSDLIGRIYQHRQGFLGGFTKNITCITWHGLRCMNGWKALF